MEKHFLKTSNHLTKTFKNYSCMCEGKEYSTLILLIILHCKVPGIKTTATKGPLKNLVIDYDDIK